MLLQQVCMAYAAYRSPAGHLQLVSTAHCILLSKHCGCHESAGRMTAASCVCKRHLACLCGHDCGDVFVRELLKYCRFASIVKSQHQDARLTAQTQLW